MENIKPLTYNENWILNCSVNDVNWRGALERLTLPEIERILSAETRKTALPKLRARKRRLEKEYAETELYECEYPDCKNRIPRTHAEVLPDGTVLCKPCDARSSQRARTETPDFEVLDMDEEDEEPDFEVLDMEEDKELEEDDNDDNDDNDEEESPQTSLDYWFGNARWTRGATEA